MSRLHIVKCGTLLASVCLPAVAQAQLTSAVPQVQTRISADSNGVDLVTGSFNFQRTDLTFGPNAQTHLALETQHGSGGGDNYSGQLYETTEGSQHYVYAVHGNRTEKFLVSGSSYIPVSGNGATLANTATNTYLLTEGSGLKIEFHYEHYSFTGLYHGSGEISYINHILYPDGERLTLSTKLDWMAWCEDFEAQEAEEAAADKSASSSEPALIPPQHCFRQPVWRTQSITSNLGYQLRYAYAAESVPEDVQDPGDFFTLTTVKAVNLAVDYCDPDSSSCTYTRSWPTLSYSVHDVGPTPSVDYTDPLGHEWSILRSVSGIVVTTSVRRPSSSTPYIVATMPDISDPKVSSVQTPAGTWTYSWSDSGSVRTATVTDPLSHTRTVVSDLTTGLITSDTDALSHTTSFLYDSNGRVTQVTNPEGDYTQYTYDARGNVTEERHVSKTSGTPADIVTTAGYPSTCSNVLTCNKPDWTQDANGNQTDYTYDSSHGGVLTVTAPAPVTSGVRPETRYTYSALDAWYKDSSGVIVASGSPVYRLTGTSACRTTASCAGTADEAKTVIAYGSTGVANNLKVSAVTASAGDGSISATSAMAYDDFGNLTSIDGPLSGSADTVTMRYDADYRKTGVIAPDPDGAGALERAAQRITYDGDDNVTQVEAGTVNGTTDTDWAGFASAQQASTAYANGFRTSEALSAGGTTYAVTQYSYDAMGRLECTAQRMNPAAWGSLPGSACTAQTAGGAGPDRIAKVTSYDAVNRVLEVTSAYGTSDAASESAAYTVNGRLASVTDGEGNKTSYEYDGHDRLVKTRYPDATKGAGTSSTTDYEQLTLDAAGNATSRRLRDGTSIGYGYDDLGRLVSKDLPGSEPDVAYTYDNPGHLTGASQTGNALTFGWDALGRNTSQGGPLGTVSYQYDAAGQRTRITWPDAFYVDYDRDVTGNVTAIRENGATSGAGVLATYGYDDLGNRTSLTRGNGVVTSYAPDAVSRLSSLSHNLTGTSYDVTTTFGYNPASQIATQTRSNDAYAWSGAANAAVAYTANGRNQYSAATGTTFGYDGRGNLTTLGSNSYTYSSENLLKTGPGVTLDYDPLLRLYQTAGSTTTQFLYDGTSMIGEYDTSGVLQRRHVFGPGADEAVASYDASGNRSWPIADERGSIVAKTDGSGNAAAIASYDEYGVPAGGDVGRFGYTGQAWLPELGMSYYKARIYAPALGRFMQTDPIGYGDGMNLHAYVKNDPVNATDPSGLSETPEECLQEQITAYLEGNEIVVCGGGGGGGGSLTDLLYQSMVWTWGVDGLTPGRGASRSGGGGGQPSASVRTRKPSLRKQQPKRDCIPLSAGPVYIDQSYGFDVGLIVGGGFSFSHFRIPSTGDSGWVASGSFLGGAGFSVGGSVGVVDTLGGLLGTGLRMGAVSPIPGVGAEWSFGDDGKVNGVSGGPAGGVGIFGGKTMTKMQSSTRPVCQ